MIFVLFLLTFFCMSSKSFILQASVICLLFANILWQISSSMVFFIFLITFLTGIMIPLIFLVSISGGSKSFKMSNTLLILLVFVLSFILSPMFFCTNTFFKIPTILLFFFSQTSFMIIFLLMSFLLLSTSILFSSIPLRVI